MVCIIDDREEVWKFTPNMVKVKPYHFFAHTADINAPRGLERKENDEKLSARKTTVHKVRKKKGKSAVQSSCDAKEKSDTDEMEEVNKKSETKAEEEEIKTKADEGNVKTDESMNIEEETKEQTDEPQPEGQSNDETKAKESGSDDEWEEVIEWEDTDDYLLYLEDILTNIHSIFFKMHDEQASRTDTPLQQADTPSDSPNLKKIIPYAKQKVLSGVNLVFSGIIPTNMPLERSRAFTIAKGLGAHVQRNVVVDGEKRTTHVVANNTGTLKVREALKHSGSS